MHTTLQHPRPCRRLRFVSLPLAVALAVGVSNDPLAGALAGLVLARR